MNNVRSFPEARKCLEDAFKSWLTVSGLYLEAENFVIGFKINLSFNNENYQKYIIKIDKSRKYCKMYLATM